MNKHSRSTDPVRTQSRRELAAWLDNFPTISEEEAHLIDSKASWPVLDPSVTMRLPTRAELSQQIIRTRREARHNDYVSEHQLYSADSRRRPSFLVAPMSDPDRMLGDIRTSPLTIAAGGTSGIAAAAMVAPTALALRDQINTTGLSNAATDPETLVQLGLAMGMMKGGPSVKAPGSRPVWANSGRGARLLYDTHVSIPKKIVQIPKNVYESRGVRAQKKLEVVERALRKAKADHQKLDVSNRAYMRANPVHRDPKVWSQRVENATALLNTIGDLERQASKLQGRIPQKAASPSATPTPRTSGSRVPKALSSQPKSAKQYLDEAAGKPPVQSGENGLLRFVNNHPKLTNLLSWGILSSEVVGAFKLGHNMLQGDQEAQIREQTNKVVSAAQADVNKTWDSATNNVESALSDPNMARKMLRDVYGAITHEQRMLGGGIQENEDAIYSAGTNRYWRLAAKIADTDMFQNEVARLRTDANIRNMAENKAARTFMKVGGGDWQKHVESTEKGIRALSDLSLFMEGGSREIQ